MVECSLLEVLGTTVYIGIGLMCFHMCPYFTSNTILRFRNDITFFCSQQTGKL